MFRLFDSVPRDVKLYLFSFLDSSEIFDVAPMVCKEWKNLAEALLKNSVLYLSKIDGIKSNPKKRKKLLEDMAQRNDLQACVALYELALLSLETSRECEWFNMRYEQALDYTKKATDKDIFLGHLINIFVCVALLGKLSWAPDSEAQRELIKTIEILVYPALLKSLFIYDVLLNSDNLDLTKYNLLPNFLHFEHRDTIDLLSDGYKNDMRNGMQYYIQQSNLSNKEIELIKDDAKKYVDSLDTTARLIRKR